MTGVYLHLGAAPAQMRVRELEQPAAVVEVLRFDDQQRLTEAVQAETRPARCGLASCSAPGCAVHPAADAATRS